jgi:tetratricopeptide (TPR) repeat protein
MQHITSGQPVDGPLGSLSDLARAHYERGRRLSLDKQSAAAIHHFQRAVTLSPDWPEVLNSPGVALGGTGQRHRVEAAFRRALELDPGHGYLLLWIRDLSKFAAPKHKEFVAHASALAHDSPRLLELRAGLRERMKRSTLKDGERIAHEMEHAFTQAWSEWCNAA